MTDKQKFILGFIILGLAIITAFLEGVAIGKEKKTLNGILSVILALIGIFASVIGLVLPAYNNLSVENMNGPMYIIEPHNVSISGKDVHIDSAIKAEIVGEDTAEVGEEMTKIETDEMLVEIKVRSCGTAEWKKSVDANVGDEIEYQIHYKNLTDGVVDNVIVEASLPTNMEYIEGTAKMFNSNHVDGATVNSNSLITKHGINIGKYAAQGDCYVRFRTRVKDVSLEDGTNRLITWAKVTANGGVNQNNADCYVEK